MQTMTITIPQNTNKFGGFYNTIYRNKRQAWTLAIREFYAATGLNPEAIRVWLEATYGRHFADQVNDRLALGNGGKGMTLEDAVRSEVRRWVRGKAKAQIINDANKWYAEELSSLADLAR